MVLGVLWHRIFEWYLNVFKGYFGFVVPFSGIKWYFKLPLSPAEISLNGTMIRNGIQW